jgi:glycosyltransferase involved in cell wall biosynthesis
MKLVLIENINPYKEASGGIGNYLKHLVRFLKSKGVHTTLVGAGTGKSDSLVINVDRYIALSDQNISHPAYIAKLLLRVRGLKLDDDVVIHGQRPDVLFPFALLRRKHKLVCSLHAIHSKAVYHKRGKAQGWFYERLEQFSLHRVNKMIAVGYQVENYFKDKYPKCKDKVVQIPVGVDMERFSPMDQLQARKKCGIAEHDKIMLYVGRLEKEKNLDMLIDAFARVKESVPESKLILVGSGTQEPYLRAYIQEGDIKDVIFWGSVKNREIPCLLNSSDVFTFASIYEGGPVVIKEALACNVPVVSTDVGDARLFIKDLKGCFIAQMESRDFARKIMEVLRLKHRDNYRDQIVAHSSDVAFNKTITLYQTLLNNK